MVNAYTLFQKRIQKKWTHFSEVWKIKTNCSHPIFSTFKIIGKKFTGNIICWYTMPQNVWKEQSQNIVSHELQYRYTVKHNFNVFSLYSAKFVIFDESWDFSQFSMKFNVFSRISINFDIFDEYWDFFKIFTSFEKKITFPNFNEIQCIFYLFHMEK